MIVCVTCDRATCVYTPSVPTRCPVNSCCCCCCWCSCSRYLQQVCLATAATAAECRWLAVRPVYAGCQRAALYYRGPAVVSVCVILLTVTLQSNNPINWHGIVDRLVARCEVQYAIVISETHQRTSYRTAKRCDLQWQFNVGIIDGAAT